MGRKSRFWSISVLVGLVEGGTVIRWVESLAGGYKKWLMFGLEAMLLILLVFIGFLVYQNKQLEDLLSEANDKIERVGAERVLMVDELTKKLTKEKGKRLANTKRVGVWSEIDDGLYIHFAGEEIILSRPVPPWEWVIDKTVCPRVFEEVDYKNFPPTAKLMYDSVHDKRFLIVYLNIFITASYGPIYGCVLDIEEERMVYEMPFLGKFNYASPREDGVLEIHLRGGNFTSSCGSCFLSLLEFVAYDPGRKRFVPVNSRFKSEFKELLAKYDKVADERCRFQGKITPVDEILKMAGENAKCEDDLRPGGNEYFMTIGEFNQIREDIQKVIDGEKESLMKYYRF